VLTGLIVGDLLARRRITMSAQAAAMTRLPQVLVNVRIASGLDIEGASGLWETVRAVEAELGDRGRVVVRSSGTEPLLRVMVEAPTEAEATAAAARIQAALDA
jgi:phosphoglucosamine mutase